MQPCISSELCDSHVSVYDCTPEAMIGISPISHNSSRELKFRPSSLEGRASQPGWVFGIAGCSPSWEMDILVGMDSLSLTKRVQSSEGLRNFFFSPLNFLLDIRPS